MNSMFRFQRRLMRPLIGRMDEWEERVAATLGTFHSVEDSPVRFEIMKEGIKRGTAGMEQDLLAIMPPTIWGMRESMLSLRENPPRPKERAPEGFLDELEVYVLKLSRGDLPPVTIYIDSITGDVLKSEAVALQEGGIGIPIVARLEDYRDFYGVRIPFRMISENEASGRTIVQYESIEVNLDIDDTFFILNASTEP